MNEIAIALQNVSVDLGGRPIIQNVSFEIERGCLTAIMGPNGGGKTTMILAILGLLPYRGKILFGTHKKTTRPRIGYVPQKLDLDHGSPITVCDLLAAGKSLRPLWTGVKGETRSRVNKALETVGIPGVMGTPIGKLSGGELQRVLLAQALLLEPEILLLDEPVAGVDVRGEALFCELLDEIHRDLKLTTLLITHDISVVAEHAHHVVCLNKSIICSGITKDVLTQDNLRKVFSPHIDTFLQQHRHDYPLNSSGINGPSA